MMTLGEKVRFVRERAGLTMDALAKQLHVSQSYISHVENNRRLLGRDRLIALAKVMEIPIEFFFRDDICTLEQLTTQPVAVESRYVNYFVVLDKAMAADISPQELERALEFIRRQKDAEHLE